MTGNRRHWGGAAAVVGMAAVGVATSGGTWRGTSTGTSPAAVDTIASPAGPGARFPSLATGPGGRVAMAWMDRDADSVAAVRLAVRDANGRWSAVRTVVRDTLLMVNWADHPTVLFHPSGDLVVHWLQRGGLKGKYDYGIRVARSRDGGATWSAPVAPHGTDEPGEHGFVSLWATADGGTAMAFLNGTESARARAPMQLGYAALNRAGVRTSVAAIDKSICDCCQTAAVMTARGPVVAYRDRTPEEIRDIYVTRLLRDAWTPGIPVARDGWKINACPVNGPALAAAGDRVALAWFTAARDTTRVFVAFSTDAGATFGTPVRVDGGMPAGHLGVLMAPDGSALVSWKERTMGEAAEVRVRRVTPDGRALAPRTVDLVTGLRPSGWPVMTATTSGAVMAWTVPGKPTTIRLALLPWDAR